MYDCARGPRGRETQARAGKRATSSKALVDKAHVAVAGCGRDCARAEETVGARLLAATVGGAGSPSMAAVASLVRTHTPVDSFFALISREIAPTPPFSVERAAVAPFARLPAGPASVPTSAWHPPAGQLLVRPASCAAAQLAAHMSGAGLSRLLPAAAGLPCEAAGAAAARTSAAAGAAAVRRALSSSTSALSSTHVGAPTVRHAGRPLSVTLPLGSSALSAAATSSGRARRALMSTSAPASSGGGGSQPQHQQPTHPSGLMLYGGSGRGLGLDVPPSREPLYREVSARGVCQVAPSLFPLLALHTRALAPWAHNVLCTLSNVSCFPYALCLQSPLNLFFQRYYYLVKVRGETGREREGGAAAGLLEALGRGTGVPA